MTKRQNNIVLPLELWPVLESNWLRESTNAGTVVFVSSNKVLATWPRQYFAVSASNEWGLVFSDVLTTAAPVRTGRIRLR